jgi:hypothetical protein
VVGPASGSIYSILNFIFDTSIGSSVVVLVADVSFVSVEESVWSESSEHLMSWRKKRMVKIKHIMNLYLN